jgi:hypothetical protein
VATAAFAKQGMDAQIVELAGGCPPAPAAASSYVVLIFTTKYDWRTW